jgi:Prokaryotic membrane lipoprotein lipid attachment site
MKRIFLLLTSLAFLSGCMAFVENPSVSDDLSAEPKPKQTQTVSVSKPFKQIIVQWKKYPILSSMKSLELRQDNLKRPFKNAKDKELEKLHKKAVKTFSEKGLYDPTNGEGQITITLDSSDVWNYGNLMTTHFTETPYLFIFPSCIYETHDMQFEFTQDGIISKLDNKKAVKTCFHLFLIPFYPFGIPSLKENKAIKLLLQESAQSVSLNN